MAISAGSSYVGMWPTVLGLLFSLAFGPTAGIPAGLLAMDRRNTIMQLLTFGVVFAITIGLIGGLTVGLLGGLLGGLVGSAWGRWLILARFWLPLNGWLPWRTVAFLDDSHHRGVLRQSGAVYQFRHGGIQDQLAPPKLPRR